MIIREEKAIISPENPKMSPNLAGIRIMSETPLMSRVFRLLEITKSATQKRPYYMYDNRCRDKAHTLTEIAL